MAVAPTQTPQKQPPKRGRLETAVNYPLDWLKSARG